MNEFHREAMDLATRGFMAQMIGESKNALTLFGDALERELAAIAELHDPIEPTHSILHRSAGWMAFHSNQYRKAEQLACNALAKDPPPDIADELRNLLEHVSFHRHFAGEGIALGEGEIRLSLLGRAVTDGITLLSDLMARANNIQTLVYRIAQWKLELSYRDRVPSSIRNRYRAFASVPPSRDFTFVVRLGHPTFQPTFPQFVGTDDIIAEFTDLMELMSGPEVHQIGQYINNPAYQRNFIGLARSLAPDGNRIRQVGFTTVSHGDTRLVSVTKPSSQFPPLDTGSPVPANVELVERSGTLRYADASAGSTSHNRIKLIGDDGSSHQVVVPSGLMDDIVRPMWNSQVTVRGTLRGRQRLIHLREIWESEPDSNRRIGQVLTATGFGDGLQYSLLQRTC